MHTSQNAETLRFAPKREGLFTRQPSEETGERISVLLPWRQETSSIYGVKNREAR